MDTKTVPFPNPRHPAVSQRFGAAGCSAACWS